MSTKRYCTHCRSETNQQKLFGKTNICPVEVSVKEERDGLSRSVWVIGAITEEVFECLGCERVHIFCTETTVDLMNPRKYQLPKRKERTFPKWLGDVNLDYIELISEIYENFNSGNYITFSIACRTLVDVILTDFLGDIGGFEKKLERFKEVGEITQKQHRVLSFLIDSGNASAHRAYKPSKEVSESTLEIIEHILKDSVLVKRAESHSSVIPKRNA